MGIWRIAAGAAFFLAASVAADDRATVPPPAEVGKAETLVKNLFKLEYAKTKAADRAAFAAKLLEQAQETTDDPAAKFVLLRDARDLAAKAGNAATALKAAELLAAEYQVGAGAAAAAAAFPLANAAATAAAGREVAERLLATAESARPAEEWEAMRTILKAADAAARKAQNVALASTVKARLKEAEATAAAAEGVAAHLAVLKAAPADPAANLAVGRFLCFAKNDWDAGLARLANSGDPKFAAAALADRKAAEGTPAEQVAAADAWYDTAADESAFKQAIQLRAHHWYTTAQSGLNGLTKVRVAKRIAELQPVADARGEQSGVWAALRAAVADGKLKKWNTVGGGFAREEFEEVPAEGGILIGFHYTTIGNGRYPGVIRPIFQTARGEVTGKIYGVPAKGAKTETVKAKPGYAIGAIVVRGGGGFDAFTPVFMKIADGGLDTADQYDGPRIGGNGGSEGTVGGDGNFIVGIHGKLGKESKVESLSVVTLTINGPEPGPKKKR